MPPQPLATGPHSPLSQVFLQLLPSLVSMVWPPPLPVSTWSPPPDPVALLAPLLPAIPNWSPGFTTSGAPEQAMASQEIRANAALLKLRLDPTVTFGWTRADARPAKR